MTILKPHSLAMNDLTACVEAFEEAIADGRRAPIELYLPDAEHPEYEAIVIELARVELELCGPDLSADPVADYQRRFPGVFARPQNLSQIAFEEFRVRRQRGEDVDRREYAARYRIDTTNWPVVAPLPNRVARNDSSVSLRHENSTEAAIARGRRLLLPSLAEIADDQLKAWLEEAFPEFELVEELGKGAFGRVFLASQRTLASRYVVIKVTSDTTSEPERLARLQHSNIVPVYSVHRTAEWQAICMPYLGRRTLRDFIDGNGCMLDQSGSEGGSETGRRANAESVEQTLRLVQQVAMGLHHAHSSGVLHRDIKPANILVTDQNQALLLDFNLSSDVVAHSLTRSIVGGTLPYLSPEHLESLQSGNPLTMQADIYSMGVILFELLSGRLPYPLKPGASLNSIVTESVAARAEKIPSVRQCRPDVSQAIDSIITKCLQPDPAHRYQTAGQLAEDLQCELDSRPLSYAPNVSWTERISKWRRRNPRLLSLTSLSVMACIGLVSCSAGFLLLINRVDRLQAESRWQQIQDIAPDVRALLSSPDASSSDIEAGTQLASTMLAELRISPTAGSDRRALNTELSLLDEERSRQLQQTVQDTAYLISAGRFRQARTQSIPEQHLRLLAEARSWNTIASSVGPANRLEFELTLQRLSIESAMGEDIAAELESIQKAKSSSNKSSQPAPPASIATAIQTLDEGRFADAERMFDELIKEWPHDFSVWYLLGKCRQVQAKWHEGDAAFSTCIAMNRNCWLAWRDRGICRLQLQQSNDAASDFRQVVAMRPEDPAACLNLALAQMQLGQLADAENSATRCIEKNGPTRAWFIRSQLKAMRQDAEGAGHDFQQGLMAEPNELDSWIARGMAILQQDPEAALKDFEAALRWYPMSRDAMQNIAHVCSERLNRSQDAVRQLDQLLQLYPSDNAARIGRGVLLARLRESTKATKDAEQVLQQKPQAIEVYQAACVYALLSTDGTDPSLASRAIELLRASLRQQPELTSLASQDPDLNPVRSLPEFRELLASAQVLANQETIATANQDVQSQQPETQAKQDIDPSESQ
ncbi:MAG: protein kinase [Planctomycetaceae bacterium]|nr:protein kinase [Planctomycetaceae bacterium]